MKKLIIPVAFVASALLTSCGGGATSAKDIDVSTLDTPCDCGDAALTVAKEMEVVFNAVGEGEPSEEQEKELDALGEKMDELENHCRKEKGFDKDKMKECESFNKAIEIMEKID